MKENETYLITEKQLEDFAYKVITDYLSKTGTINSLKFDFLTVKEASELFQITADKLYKWSRKGLLKTYKIDKIIYFKRNELIDTLKRWG